MPRNTRTLNRLMRGRGSRAFIFAVIAALAGGVGLNNMTSQASTLEGTASVIDGDTIEIHGERVRMHGIDAPESSQTCQRSNRESWPCGKEATWALAEKADRKSVRCEGETTDHYGRLIAVCYRNGENLNQWMVQNGWAVAYRRYSRDYVRDESAAQSAGRNIWSGDFVMPWDWRKGDRL